jgi:hypothetical protein
MAPNVSCTAAQGTAGQHGTAQRSTAQHAESSLQSHYAVSRRLLLHSNWLCLDGPGGLQAHNPPGLALQVAPCAPASAQSCGQCLRWPCPVLACWLLLSGSSSHHCDLLQDVCCLCNVALSLLHCGQPPRQTGTLNLNKDLQHRDRARQQSLEWDVTAGAIAESLQKRDRGLTAQSMLLNKHGLGQQISR